MKKNITNQEVIIEFHNEYSKIVAEQNKLPRKKGMKDYSDIESQIIKMALELDRNIFKFLNEITSDQSKADFVKELENMQYGVQNVQRNPYFIIS